MTNRIYKSGLAAVAMAASAVLLAAPASADHIHGHHGKHKQSTGSVIAGVLKHKALGGDVHHGGNQHFNTYGQTSFQVSKLKQEAIYQCSYQLRIDAKSYGYKGSQAIETDVQQIDKYKFAVHSKAKLFDGFKFSHEAYDCVVADGQLIKTSDLKQVGVFGNGFGSRGRGFRSPFQ